MVHENRHINQEDVSFTSFVCYSISLIISDPQSLKSHDFGFEQNNFAMLRYSFFVTCDRKFEINSHDLDSQEMVSFVFLNQIINYGTKLKPELFYNKVTMWTSTSIHVYSETAVEASLGTSLKK